MDDKAMCKNIALPEEFRDLRHQDHGVHLDYDRRQALRIVAAAPMLNSGASGCSGRVTPHAASIW